MPFIASVVNYINDTLKANCSLLTDGTYYGISSVIARKKSPEASLEQLPGILVNHTQYKTIEPNDKHKLIVYHKIVSNAYAWDKSNSYGDGYRQKCTTEMLMVVWGDGKKLGIDEELEAAILFSMPQALSRMAMLELGFQACTITPYGSTLDRLTVFRQEYPQTPFFLKPNHQFFSIRYRVESLYDKRCMDLCVAKAALTFASAQTFTVGLQLVEQFRVGDPGSPMQETDTVYANPAIAGKAVFVMASSLGVPVDDGSGSVDFSVLNIRYVRKVKADAFLEFVGGGVVREEIIGIYISN